MKKYLIIITFIASAFIGTSQIFINEIMAKNDFTIADEFGEYDDWIEFYNSSGDDIDLAGSYVTDNMGNLTLFQVETGSPALTTVPANGYLILWADGTPEQGANHLGLSLSAGGESVALVFNDGETIASAFQFPDQENDISYGRSSDGSIELQYFSIPTPNATNQEITPENHIVHINELMSENVTSIFDENGVYEPWIEFYNTNDFQVNLAGYTIDYNNGEAQYLIENTDPNATVIESENYKLFWCDGQDIEGIRHTNFTLGNNATIKLIAPDGTTVVAEYEFISPGSDLSLGSQSDGDATYISFDTPTPDVTNDLAIVLPEELYINEIMASNLTDTLDNFGENEDWIEIYNPNNFPVDLSGYHISDNLGGGSWEIPSTYPDSVTVAAEGFILFWADNDEEQGVRHTDFKLTSGGEDVVLLSTDNFSQADYFAFPVMSDDISWGREEDGSNTLVYFIPEDVTPEYSNHGAVGVKEVSELGVNIFPNPASDIVNFGENFRQVELFDQMGRAILELSSTSEISVSDLETGVYVLVFNGVHTERVIVE